MSVNPDFRDLFVAFFDHDVRFMVVGAHAVVHYTVPRYTKDLDVWISPASDNARRTHAALAAFGAPLETLSVADLEAPGTIFQIGVEPNRIDVLTMVEGIEFEAAWSRRLASTYGGVPISILSRQDLLAAKRAAGRPQDLLDAENLERAPDDSEDDGR